VTLLDVLVVGGGPVGLAVAIEARMAGLSVVVYEPRPTPVDKACGEGLMPGALTALDRLGVRPSGHPFAGIRYVDGRHTADHRFRSGPGLGVRRTALQAALAARVAGLGIEVRPERVSLHSQDGTGVQASDGGRARWMLACDGLQSGIRRQLGLQVPVRQAPRFGVRRHFQAAPWSDLVEVHWTPLGEVYVTPVADDMVGVAVLGGRGAGYAEVLGAAPAVAERIAAAPSVSELRGAGPLRQRTRRRTLGRVLLVGDASGYVDALTGEGIRLGLAQARAAVAAVVSGRPEHYERAWRSITRDYRLLTSSLVQAAGRPALRRRIVPFAARLPGVFGAVVERLAA
jgi:menaquinone-9 beta-reductase